jgi:type IV pilus assembly protein PilN
VIRTNLSTRPFYNERAVHFWLLIAALLILAATIFNVTRVLRYSRSDTELATRAASDEARARDLRRQAVELRASVDPRQVEFASTEARMANELIDRRTFSWTQLLNTLEATLPDDVRIVSVKPKLGMDRGIVLTISVVARSVDDVDNFMKRLETTGEFGELGARLSEHVNEQGLIETILDATYVPSQAPAAEAAKPTRTARPARR